MTRAFRIDIFILLCAFTPRALLSNDSANRTVSIENFEGTGFHWETRHPMLKEHPEYIISQETNNHYLHAAPIPGREGNIAYLKFNINLHETPLLRWRWKVEKFPNNPQEGSSGPNDTAASVYIYFESGLKKRVIKYVWCLAHPSGEWLTAPGSTWFWKTRVLAIRFGPPLNEWKEETVDLQKDFTAAFGASPPKKAFGIGVLTDGDQTHSESIGDYDDFVALPSKP